MSTPTKNLEGRGMKERSIVLKSWEVKATLEGSKTVTRRLVKPVRGYTQYKVCRPDLASAPHDVWWHGEYQSVGVMQACPYGQPGDRLWVRETWAETDRNDGTPVVAYAAGGCIAVGRDGSGGPDVLINNFCWDQTPHVVRWRPSIHMPRWASRITLEVTGVRVERLKDIDHAQAMAEGIDGEALFRAHGYAPTAFERLWESINGAGSWGANPYVWVIDFKRIEQQAMAA